MLTEDPHEIKYKGEPKVFFADETYAIGFDENFEPYVGKPGRAHGDLTGYDDPPNDRPDFFYPGRIWKKEKVISFWRYPSKYQLYKLLERIEGEFKRRFPNKEPLDFSDRNWKVELWKNVSGEDSGGETVDLVRLSNYQKPSGAGNGRSHASKLNEKKLRKIIQENIRRILESPDGFTLDSGTKLTFVDGDAYGFGFDKNLSETYISKARHSDFDNVVEYEDPPPYRDDFEYPGRFWRGYNIISFWEYPDKFKIGQILKKLEDEFRRRYPDKKPLNFKKNDWKVEKWSYSKGHIDLVPVEDYDGFASGTGSITHTSNLAESPEAVEYGDGYLHWSDDGAYAIGYDKENNAYIGNEGERHATVEKYYDNAPFSRNIFEYPGRIWKNEKVISFWDYPTSYKLFPLLKQLEKEWRRRFPDKKPLDFTDSDWRIEKWNDSGETVEYVSLVDYEGFDKESDYSSHTSNLIEQEEEKLREVIRELVKSIL